MQPASAEARAQGMHAEQERQHLRTSLGMRRSSTPSWYVAWMFLRSALMGMRMRRRAKRCTRSFLHSRCMPVYVTHCVVCPTQRR